MKKPVSTKYLLTYWILLSFFRISGQQKTDSLPRSNTSHYKSSLLFNGHISENTKAFGGKFMVTLLLKKHPDYGIGFNLASEKLFIPPTKLDIPSNITTNILFGVAGFHIQNKLNEQVFFQPEFSFLYGRQEITKLISTPSILG